MILKDKTFLITGILTDKSIAFASAKIAIDNGAKIIATGFGEGLRTLVRANGVGVTFAALLIVLLGGDEENARQVNIVRYIGGLLLIGFAVFTNFNGFLIFGVTEIALALYTGRQLRPSSGSDSYTPNVED